MKKTYIAPFAIIVKTDLQQMVCGSINVVGDALDVHVNPTEPSTPGDFDENTINARENNLEFDEEEWDEEEA
jgi:hypothetical protein